MMKASKLILLMVAWAGLVTMLPGQTGGTSAAATASHPADASQPPAGNAAVPDQGGKKLTPDVTNQIKSEVEARAKDESGSTAGSVAVSLPRGAGGRRDPFVSPMVTVKKESPMDTVECGSGKRCLIIDQLVLKGIVKSREGMMAMVENPQQKSYVLHEKDPVYRGSVVRITPDSVVFQQNVVDSTGHQSQHLVVKKVETGPKL